MLNVNVASTSIFSGKLLEESILLLFLSTPPILYWSFTLEFIMLNPGESFKKKSDTSIKNELLSLFLTSKLASIGEKLFSTTL